MYDIVVIAPVDDPIVKRVDEIAHDFGYSRGHALSVDDYMERAQHFETGFIVCSATRARLKSDIAGMTQVIRNFAVDAFIVMVLDGKMSPEDAQFVKKSGANLILLELDAIGSSKIDLIASQKIKYKYLPVKVSEFGAETVINCDVFHLMPLNNKYLKIIKTGSTLPKEKIQKLAQAGEVYIRKEEVKDFEKYVSAHHDPTANGAASRCRAQLLNLTAAYIDLILMVLDQSEHTSYALGRELYERCSQLAGELLTSLGAVEEPWDIINNTSIGEFGSVERGPAIAAYSGLLCMNAGIGNPLDVMVAALLMDVGLLDIDPRIMRKMRSSGLTQLSPSDREEYQQHPVGSLHRVLGRKLPVNESIKNIILSSHESYDGQGFPHHWKAEKVSLDAMLVQLAALIDEKCLIKMGQARPDINSVRASIIQTEFSQRSKFSLDFIQKVHPFLSKDLDLLKKAF